MRRIYSLFIILFFICGISMVYGKNNQQKVKATGRDSAFIKEVESSGMMEAQLGRIAEKNASSPEVKQFGERMVKDHSLANSKLKKVALEDNLPVITKLRPVNQNTINKLSKLSGKKFDFQYMKTMVGDHKAAVQNFENASDNVFNKNLKTWINNTLPTLKDHLEFAEKIFKQLNNN